MITSQTRAELSKDHLKFLTLEQVAMIDEALQSLGEFGEVRLAVQKGRLRFVVLQRSIDAFKWEPGDLSANGRLSS